jgi:hypothetical protein
MTRYALRIASILIITHSLLFIPAPVSRAQDRPTEAEVKQAQDEIFEDLIPPKVVRLFNNHPVLKDFIDIDVEFFRCAI